MTNNMTTSSAVRPVRRGSLHRSRKRAILSFMATPVSPLVVLAQYWRDAFVKAGANLPLGHRGLPMSVTALTQHRLGHSPGRLRRAHRDRRDADRLDRDRYLTLRCPARASGAAHARHLDSPHADAAARPAATFLAAQLRRTPESCAPRCPPAKAAD